MVDAEGYRSNVGIIIMNGQGRLLWAKRYGQDGWQFPQGGIDEGEDAEAAMYRELHEEVGLKTEDVKIIGVTNGWLRYKLPENLRRNNQPKCIGQKQKWFLLKLVGDESTVCFDCGDKPEFDQWQWVNYWYPLGQVVSFKRDVYRKALLELVSRYARSIDRDNDD